MKLFDGQKEDVGGLLVTVLSITVAIFLVSQIMYIVETGDLSRLGVRVVLLLAYATIVYFAIQFLRRGAYLLSVSTAFLFMGLDLAATYMIRQAFDSALVHGWRKLLPHVEMRG